MFLFVLPCGCRFPADGPTCPRLSHTLTLKTPGCSTRQLMCVWRVSSVASGQLWTQRQSRTYRRLFHSCVQTGSSAPPPHPPTSFCTFSKRTGWRSFVPRNVFTSLPVNTLAHALMHAEHTRTHQQRTSPPPRPPARPPSTLASALLAMLSAPVGRAPSSQPRRGTFGSSFQWQKQRKIKQKKKKKTTSDVFFHHLLLL